METDVKLDVDEKMDVDEILEDSEASTSEGIKSTTNILTSDCFPVNHILEYSKDGCTSIQHKNNCKVLKFTRDWKFEEILEELAKFQPTTFPNLLVIIIDVKEVMTVMSAKPAKRRRVDETPMDAAKSLLDELRKFTENRPFILQITTKGSKKETKFYYKDKNSNEFLSFDCRQEHPNKITNFQSFIFTFLNAKIENFENMMLDVLPNVDDLRLIWEFLNTLELPEDFFSKIIIKCASEGTNNQLLTVLKGKFENAIRSMSASVMNSITRIFKIDSSEKSILSAAVESSNTEIMKYLTDECSNLIKLLPFSHQLEVSTAAFDALNEEFLCDLIEFCDFPFPKDFDEDMTENERIQAIIKDRKEFHKAIKNGNIDKIDSTVDKFLGHKIIYNTENVSALFQAVKKKNFNTFHYLKTKYGFEATSEEENDIKTFLKTFAHKLIATDANIQSSISSDDKSVAALISKSSVQLTRTNKHKYKECHEKIKKWFHQIHEMKFGPALLKVVSSCYKLKIVFDFENKCTNKIDYMESDKGTIGIAFADLKWVLIGAKDSDQTQIERRIRRTIAHECCHYAVQLVFKNLFKPYYNIKINEIQKLYHDVIRQIYRLLENSKDQKGEMHDNCDNIIEFAYTCYGEITDDKIPLGIEQELIVRVVEMLAHYHGNEEKISELEMTFKPLIDFYANHVNSEFKKFDFEKQRLVSELNEKTGILRELKRSMYVKGEGYIELSSSKDLSSMTSSKTTIVTTNIKNLLLFDIYNNIHPNGPDLCDTENVFVSAEQLEKIDRNEKNEILNGLEDVLAKTSKLNIFIDCTKSTTINPAWHNYNQNANYIYVVDKQESSEKLKTINTLKNATNVEIIYDWNDLSDEGRKSLLQRQNNIRKNLNSSILKQLQYEENTNVPSTSSSVNVNRPSMRHKIWSKDLLKLLIENSTVKENLKFEDSEFEFLYEERIFICNERKISLKDLLSLTSSDKYVLLYGDAGAGKSWAVKGAARKIIDTNPEKWVAYVDLKQFIKIFRSKDTEVKSQQIKDNKIDFAAFMAEHIINAEWDFEKEIFLEMYRIGKVVIFFDGFDEIVPDCAGFVSLLAQSFDRNEGNQLWISTRSNYEVDLREILNLSVSYTLESLSDWEGVNLIAKTWAYNYLKNDLKTEIKSKDDFQQKYKELNKKYDYKSKASELVEKVSQFQMNRGIYYNPIGQIQLFKIFADIGKDSIDSIENLSEYTIYDKCIDQHYKIWDVEKGEIRQEANVNIQKHDSNFFQFHIHEALMLLFPMFIHLCKVKKEWTDDEVIGCGLMEIRNKKPSFIHRTFAEFLVASFAVGILEEIKKKTEEVDEDSLKLIAEIIKNRELNVIHTFINGALAENNRIEKIEEAVEKDLGSSRKNFHKILEKLNLVDVINEKCFDFNEFKNLKHLIREALIKLNYEKVKEILIDALRNKFDEMQSQKNMEEQGALVSVKKDNSSSEKEKEGKRQELLEEIVKMLKNILYFFDDNELLKKLVNRIKQDHGLEITKSLFKKKVEFYSGSKANLVQIISIKCNYEELSEYVSFLNEFLSIDEIVDLILDIVDVRYKSGTILHINVLMLSDNKLSVEEFKSAWKKYENFFNFRNSAEKFKQLLGRNSNNYYTILYAAAEYCKQPDTYKVIWELLLQTYENNRDELWNFINQVDGYRKTFIYCLVKKNRIDAILFTFNSIKSHFGTEKLLDLLLRRDKYGDNAFQNNAFNFPTELMDYLLNELQQKGMKRILSNLNDNNQCFLQTTVSSLGSNSVYFPQNTWNIFRKVFNPSEMLFFIKNCDKYGDNILHHVVKKKTKEIIELTWNEFQTTIKEKNKEIAEKYSEKINEIDQYIKYLLQNMEYINDSEIESFFEIMDREIDAKKLDLSWIEDENLWIFKLPAEQFQEHLSEGKIFNIPTDSNDLAACPDLEIHKISWEFLQNKFNQEELKNFVLHVSWTGNNYIHQVMNNENPKVMEFTLEILKSFNKTQMREILSSKGSVNRNLLQSAICCAKSDEIFYFLWKILEQYFEKSEIEEIIEHVDADGNNLLFHAARWSSKDIFEFIWKKVILNDESIPEILQIRNRRREDIILLCVRSADTEKFKFVWEEFENVFKSKKLMHKFREYLMQENFVVVRSTIFYYQSIMHEIARYCDNIDFHQVLWQLLQKTFESHHEELWNFINKNDGNKRNFIFTLVEFNKPEIIKFTFETMKEKFGAEKLLEMLEKSDYKVRNVLHHAVCKASSENIEILIEELQKLTSHDDIRQMLSILNEDEENLFQSAATDNKDLKSHEMLWKYFQNDFKQEEMLNFIKHRIKYMANYNGYNMLELVFWFNTEEVAKFTFNKIKNEFGNEELLNILEMDGKCKDNILHCTVKKKNSIGKFNFFIEELEQLTSAEKTKEWLSSFDGWNHNLLQSAMRYNKSLSDHVNLWNCFKGKFNQSEILDFIRYTCKHGNNLLHYAVQESTIEIIEFIWKQIKSFMSKSEQVDYLKTKGYQGKGLHEYYYKNPFRDDYDLISNIIRIKKIMSEYGIETD